MKKGIVGRCLAGFIVVAPVALADAPKIPAQVITEANREEAKLNTRADFVRDAALDSRLSAFLQRLTANDPDAAAITFRIHALIAATPYVFCLDNGAIYVSTGLLARVQNESQLATLIATELTPVVRADSARSAEIARERVKQSALPNILLVTVTAGLAAFPLTRQEASAQEKLRTQLRLESDQLALRWLQSGGFDVAEAPRAFRRLLDTLQAESRFGTSLMSSQSGLQRRIEEVTRAMPASPQAASASPDADALRDLAQRFTLQLARFDLADAGSKSFLPLIDRFDREFGISGESAFLRAESVRMGMRSDAQLPEAIHLYEICTALSDAPPQAHRELAFLYRKRGDAAAAREAFASYLQRAPNAADAPIIRSYMEKL